MLSFTKLLGSTGMHQMQITLPVIFDQNQLQLTDWIEKGLVGKEFIHTTADALSTYEVKESPILKIEVGRRNLVLHVDKASYIRY